MARLTDKQWEKARAEYEIRGISLGDIARQFNVNTSSVSRKAKAENWVQGKMQDIVDKKVACVKELMEIETETQELPLSFRHTIETVAKERLRADVSLAQFDVALLAKGMELIRLITSPEEFEILARGRKHLAPQQPKETTTVNVNQKQEQQLQVNPLSPRDALMEITRQAKEYSEAKN